MITYTMLNKAEKEHWLPVLFSLYHKNMHPIAPSGMSYEEELLQWLSNIAPALEKAPRQILLCFSDREVVGYIQYYTRQDLLMIEEIQLAGAFRRSTVFLGLTRRLIRILPAEIRFLEAYAMKENLHSISLMERLGMKQLPMPADSPFVHLRGDADRIKKIFLNA